MKLTSTRSVLSAQSRLELDRKFPKNSVYHTRHPFLETSENAVPFVIGNFRKFKPEFSIE